MEVLGHKSTVVDEPENRRGQFDEHTDLGYGE